MEVAFIIVQTFIAGFWANRLDWRLLIWISESEKHFTSCSRGKSEFYYEVNVYCNKSHEISAKSIEGQTSICQSDSVSRGYIVCNDVSRRSRSVYVISPLLGGSGSGFGCYLSIYPVAVL